MRKSLLIITLLSLCLVSMPAEVYAEKFIDIYFGNSKTDSGKASAKYEEGSFWGPSIYEEETREVSYRESSVFGVRGGKWIDDKNFGIALDISYFEANSNNVEVSALPISCLAMLRYPLMKNNEYPNGKIYPYVGLGIAIVPAEISVDFRPNVRKEISGTTSGFGMDFRLGLVWKILENVAIFGEYRNLHADLDWDNDDDDWDWDFVEEEASVDFTTKQLFVGLSFLY